jgi:hypothetical protein
MTTTSAQTDLVKEAIGKLVLDEIAPGRANPV